jgi:hypothetical protein
VGHCVWRGNGNVECRIILSLKLRGLRPGVWRLLCRFFDLPAQTLLQRIAALRNHGTQIATPAGGPAAPTPQPPTRMSTMTAVMRLAGTIVVVVAALLLVATSPPACGKKRIAPSAD